MQLARQACRVADLTLKNFVQNAFHNLVTQKLKQRTRNEFINHSNKQLVAFLFY